VVEETDMYIKMIEGDS